MAAPISSLPVQPDTFGVTTAVGRDEMEATDSAGCAFGGKAEMGRCSRVDANFSCVAGNPTAELVVNSGWVLMDTWENKRIDILSSQAGVRAREQRERMKRRAAESTRFTYPFEVVLHLSSGRARHLWAVSEAGC
jgi:hypothetical protein